MTVEREELLPVIHSLAHTIAQYQYPGQYDYSNEQIRMILLCAGLNEKYLEEYYE